MQLIKVTSVASINIMVGAIMVWSAVALTELSDTLGLALSQTDMMWMATTPVLLGLFVAPCTGPLMEAVGPRRVMLYSVLALPITWLVLAFVTSSSIVIHAMRIIQGVLQGIVATVQSPFVADICEVKRRGPMLVIPQLMFTAGALLVYALLTFLPYMWAHLVLCALSILMAFMFFYIPESPYWLLSKKRREEAEKSLSGLRSGDAQSIQSELTEIEIAVNRKTDSTVKDQIKLLGDAKLRRPVVILASLFALREFGGVQVLLTFTVTLFNMAGSSLSPLLCTVIVGVTMFVTSLLTMCATRMFRRRPFLIITQSMGVLFMFAFGLNSWAMDHLEIDPTVWGWIPILTVMGYIAAYSISMPIPFVLIGEYLDPLVRPIGGSICFFANLLAKFIIGQAFLVAESAFGLTWVLAVFVLFNIFATILTIVFLPETFPQ